MREGAGRRGGERAGGVRLRGDGLQECGGERRIGRGGRRLLQRGRGWRGGRRRCAAWSGTAEHRVYGRAEGGSEGRGEEVGGEVCEDWLCQSSRMASDGGRRVTGLAPLIQAGIEPPVRNPTQSFVNELQLNSAARARSVILHACEHNATDLVDGTAHASSVSNRW